MQWTLEQLKYADEICFPDTFRKAVELLDPEFFIVECLNFKEGKGLMDWVMRQSRRSGFDLQDKVIHHILTSANWL